MIRSLLPRRVFQLPLLTSLRKRNCRSGDVDFRSEEMSAPTIVGHSKGEPILGPSGGAEYRLVTESRYGTVLYAVPHPCSTVLRDRHIPPITGSNREKRDGCAMTSSRGGFREREHRPLLDRF